MEALLKEFLNNRVNIKEFINLLINNKYKVNENEIISLLDKENDEEKTSIVYLILYFIYRHQFVSSNPFLDFLDSIKSETENDFTKEIIYCYLHDNVAIFKIDHIYFIINNNDDSITVDLPTDIQNDYQFCVNCNHELYFGKTLHLESYEFYLISDVK